MRTRLMMFSFRRGPRLPRHITRRRGLLLGAEHHHHSILMLQKPEATARRFVGLRHTSAQVSRSSIVKGSSEAALDDRRSRHHIHAPKADELCTTKRVHTFRALHLPPTRATRRSSPVVRPKARLQRTCLRTPPKRALGRHRSRIRQARRPRAQRALSAAERERSIVNSLTLWCAAYRRLSSCSVRPTLHRLLRRPRSN